LAFWFEFEKSQLHETKALTNICIQEKLILWLTFDPSSAWLRMGLNGKLEQSVSIGAVQLRKVVHLEWWTDFCETFPVGPNR